MNAHAPAQVLRGLQSGRSRRVLVLIAGIIVLSVVDLIITLTHLKGAGMAEANPLARFVINATGSPISLASFKLLTVLVCVGLLYKVRRTVQAELAAWCALGILACMSAMWFSYSRNLDSPMEVKLAQTSGVRGDWVQFE
jgi:hypothetical protein